MRPHRTPATVLAAVTIILGLSACTSAPEKPASMTALPECGWLPNCVNTGADNSGVPPLAASREQWQALTLWLSRQPNWEIINRDGNFMQLTSTTPTLRFTDDVQLLFIPEQQVIQVRSSSRLGISDMGTNARRVEALREQLADLD